MKYLFALICAASLSACVTGADGKKHYAGPTVSGSIGFNGVSVGITLVGDPALQVVTLPPVTAK